MGNFIYGWRRKAGLVTLVMACVLAGAWVRGSGLEDSIVFPLGTNTFSIVSAGPTLLVTREFDRDAGTKITFPKWKTADPSTPSQLQRAIHQNSIFWQWRCQGFGYFDCTLEDIGFRLTLLAFPYTLVTISLTLISAYLLIVKSRVAKNKAAWTRDK